ncbi:hypothetical protein PVK63_19480 [Aliivibrio sp. S2TY2]|uniref:hypothetical protein n=1 Tax=unclassified Aliivibrio TaxID=2645654 RepID=UPI002379CD32|nr:MULTISPECIES: hypothetical protein [unclassified Aliivibrio]MDD9177030.1 hypothetical protein [Aliivibrio sp. S3TY1]MDD9194131.1 hypothetical protein [Aliivibrio sp. S2TY2]
MNILILRHSAEQAEINGKRHVTTASELSHSTGYALNKAQIASVSAGTPIYIIDKDNELAFFGEIESQKERFVQFPKKRERRQDFYIKDLSEREFVHVPFIKGWETHRGVKVMALNDFEQLFQV